jgi:hypothetical protein
MCAHTQTILPRDWGRRTVHPTKCRNPATVTFIAHGGLISPVLAHMLNSLVRVSRRGKENHFAKCLIDPTKLQAASSQFNQTWQTLITAPHNASKGGSMMLLDTDFLCFRFSNFRYSLTLFSKSFASFPHGTCALSVSHQYLALDGIYHPLRAAIPNNSTL